MCTDHVFSIHSSVAARVVWAQMRQPRPGLESDRGWSGLGKVTGVKHLETPSKPAVGTPPMSVPVPGGDATSSHPSVPPDLRDGSSWAPSSSLDSVGLSQGVGGRPGADGGRERCQGPPFSGSLAELVQPGCAVSLSASASLPRSSGALPAPGTPSPPRDPSGLPGVVCSHLLTPL